jgi:hypothetical protein
MFNWRTILIGAATWAALIGAGLSLWKMIVGELPAAPAQVQAPTCMDAEMREHARKIMIGAIDDSLRRHTMKTFDTWMRDPTEQPARAVRGMQMAVRAFVGAHREAKNWNPHPCKE